MIVFSSDLSFGQRVKMTRKHCKLTQRQLAEKCRLSSRAVRCIENELTEPKIFTVAQIARALGVSIDSLVYGI